MAFTVREKYTACIASTAVAEASPGTHLAVALDKSVDGAANSPIPAVTLTGTTENAVEVYGTYISGNGHRARIQTGGIATFRSKVEYGKALNGHGIVASDTAGIVQASADVGAGTGRIFGGHTTGDDYYVYVDLDA